MPTLPLPPEDLDHILAHTRDLWPQLRNQRLFLTGGTGFFGHWLIESFLHANRALALNAQVTVLTRDARAFRGRSPHLANALAVTLHEGDVRTFAFPPSPHAFILHAAADSSCREPTHSLSELASSIVEGTSHTLNFASYTSASRFLFISSGAVYGRNLTGITHIPETFPINPDPPQPAYDEAKRQAEQLCLAAAYGTQLACSIARCFAFIGPHLPLDTHFAIGNFIRDAIAASPIRLYGDGTPLRSYLYAADLAIWLWTMLFRAPRDRAYNVGSEHALSIRELAYLTANTLRPTPSGHSSLAIEQAERPTLGAPITAYVPDTTRAQNELGLKQSIALEEAIRRTAVWHGYVSS